MKSSKSSPRAQTHTRRCGIDTPAALTLCSLLRSEYNERSFVSSAPRKPCIIIYPAIK